ncbi:hypothetical protein HPB50_004046 [Hyalomma asiaticum]|uniref:Uncharacterized protein n=1 Tax=Hyalomma asiaticum TaxID=266040 RepID=A0ACB7SHU3_HYAAI|nr:hypothetical protein HPB50_004046 [Hyalomma asiaticum]
MYNGIGLQTARGSGTNGYVQRNLSLVQRSRDKVSYKTEEDIQRLDAQLIRKANSEILDHERKRKLEIKCLELQETMEEQGDGQGWFLWLLAARATVLSRTPSQDMAPDTVASQAPPRLSSSVTCLRGFSNIGRAVLIGQFRLQKCKDGQVWFPRLLAAGNTVHSQSSSQAMT